MEDNIVSVNDITSEEKTLAIIAHALVLLGVAVPFGSIIGPLVIWLIKKDQSKFVDYHGKESLNFAISLAIYYIICIILFFVFIGVIMLAGLGIFALIASIIAMIKTSECQYYRYPMCIRFIK